MKSGHVTDHVQKTSAKARHDVHVKVGKIQKWERPVGVSVTENEARERKNTHKHRRRAKPAMYSFLWALNSFMWMCSMATGLLLRSTFSDTLYFLTSLNASVEQKHKLWFLFFIHKSSSFHANVKERVCTNLMFVGLSKFTL